MTLLEIENLQVSFKTAFGRALAVNGLDLTLEPGETLALVGESGSGKSVTALATMGLLPKESASVSGKLEFAGIDLLTLTESQFQKVRGREIGMIFQDPMTSLNPTMRIGNQILEGIRCHRHLTRQEEKKAVLNLIEKVGIPNPPLRARQYPHELSGGMRQRVMIAIALACRPKLIIADEPTTALDVTLQAQVLDLLKELQAESGASILLISHDLGVVAGTADRVAVMYAGRVVESAGVDALFASPQHPYTQALLKSIPQLDQRAEELYAIPGSPPSLSRPMVGCPFSPRCESAMCICQKELPPHFSRGQGHKSACWHHDARAPVKESL